jgi:GTP pyrophosphokinase/guanosine-3',5'-bis(diphosphate) 3'-pyrophosphohydrolase
MKQDESLDLGEKLLAQAMRAEGLQMPAGDESNGPATALWQTLIRWSGNRHKRELLVDIGLGKKIATIVAKRLAKLLAEAGTKPDALTLSMSRYLTDDSTPTQAMITLDGSEGGTVQMASCCRPIPGDAIVGYLGRGEGLVVHTGECLVGKRLYQRDSERWIAVEWADELTRMFDTAVVVLVLNQKGVLAKVAQAVSEAEADITHIDMGHDPGQSTTELKLLLAVRDRIHLAHVLRTLKRSPLVLRVSRLKPQ